MISRRWRRRAPALLAVAVALLAVGLGLWVQRERAEVATVSDVITRPAPQLGPLAQELLPNLEDAVVVVPDRPHDPAEVRDPARRASIQRTRSFTVSTNAAGLRGPPLRDPPGEPRILCVGDSVTFGWGVAEEQSWPRRLERLLRPTLPEVEVINAGVPARKPDEMAAWMEQEGAALAPDLVLFTRRPDPRLPDPVGAYVAAVVRAGAVAPVWVVLPPISRFDPAGLDAEAGEVAALTSALPERVILSLTAAFRDAPAKPGVDLERAPGVQRLVRLPGRELILEAPAPEHGLAPEIMAAFEADPDLAEPYFFDGGHPDADGFEIFARAVFNELVARGWPPAPPPASGAPSP